MIDIEKLKSGDRRTLSKAITLIESSKKEDQVKARELIKNILPFTGKSFRLGVTGSPGVGKSTFIEHFGQYLIKKNHKIAVLAIDPSSPTSGGSILGDKTRMEKLANEPNAFIRPTPSSGTLGGVAQKTREAMLLCEAAGFDFIIVETVGVGQSEYEVANMVDFFMLLILPSGGDELQGIKKGILELVHSIVINKADGDNINLAKQTMAQYQSALQITSHQDFWKTSVMTSSSENSQNFEIIHDVLTSFQKTAVENNQWESRREKQNLEWFNTLLKDLILRSLQSDQDINKKLELVIRDIKESKTSPLEAAQEIAEQFIKKMPSN